LGLLLKRFIIDRLGRAAEARLSYEKALALTQQEPERQFLQEDLAVEIKQMCGGASLGMQV
jgi:predicted RNA polymerase sigma factor